MNRRKLGFIELISNLCRNHNGLFSPASKKLLAPVCFVHDVLFDQLVGRNVDHVVLDCEVAACSVGTQSFLMVDDQDLWFKDVVNFTNQGAQTLAGVDINHFDLVSYRVVDLLESSDNLISFFFLCFDLLLSFFRDFCIWFSLLRDVVSLNPLRLRATASNDILWRDVERLLNPGNEFLAALVQVAIKYELCFSWGCLNRVNHILLHLLLNCVEWNFSFKWFVFCT